MQGELFGDATRSIGKGAPPVNDKRVENRGNIVPDPRESLCRETNDIRLRFRNAVRKRMWYHPSQGAIGGCLFIDTFVMLLSPGREAEEGSLSAGVRVFPGYIIVHSPICQRIASVGGMPGDREEGMALKLH
jgi:hypothetical protein